MIIGVPKEIKNNENRVAMTPAGVQEMVARGHKVYVQATAGNGSGFSDEEYIKAGGLYFWKDGKGQNVASCNFAPNGSLAAIQLVFTRPECRRKHYAENLVYRVTEIAMAAGYTPMLYTDADYIASNACYEKIGYVLQGKLCTLS